MKKKKTLANLVDEAAVLLQKLVRMKAADHKGNVRCVTCGKVGRWKEFHGGHYVPRGKWKTKLIEENVHPQCVSCNTYRAEHAKLSYRRFMDEMYGPEFVEELEQKGKEVIKFPRYEIEEMIADLKARIKEQEKRLGDR